MENARHLEIKLKLLRARIRQGELALAVLEAQRRQVQEWLARGMGPVRPGEPHHLAGEQARRAQPRGE